MDTESVLGIFCHIQTDRMNYYDNHFVTTVEDCEKGEFNENYCGGVRKIFIFCIVVNLSLKIAP